MKVLFTICSVLVSIVCVSQVATPLHFQEEIFDFGVVGEEGGAVVHDFHFTNNSLEPVRIISVQASCGCTTPAWTKDPIDPGMTGFIQASYNPKGRPGYFNKSLSVTSSADSNPLILQIKGQVSSGEGSPTANAEFRSSNGNWKLKSGSFNLGKVYMTDGYSVRDFQILNGGTKVIKYTGKFVGPGYIKVDVQPLALAPGEKGHIKISYNGKMKGLYGFQSDNIEIITDDELSPTKSFSVYATLEDNFQDLSPEEIANAAQLRLREQEVDFGRIRPNETSVKEVQFLNSGKAILDIRSVKGNCTCISATAYETSLEPGETGTLKIEFNPGERKGTQQKAVTVYSNDPRNPVQRLIFTAYIED
jgi:hypothetical protein